MEDLTQHEDGWKTYAGIWYGVGYISQINNQIYVEHTLQSKAHAIILKEFMQERWPSIRYQIFSVPLFTDIEYVLNCIVEAEKK